MEPNFTKGGSRGYVLQDRFSWNIGKPNSSLVIHIPKGYEFESSVPVFLRWVLSPDDPLFLKAACIHDYLLENGYSRPFADTQWLDAARSVNAPRFKRETAFVVIRSRSLFRK